MIRRKILVPVNFTSQSDAALRYAIKIASSMNGMITCLHVNEEPDFITGNLISKDISDRIRRLAEEKLSLKANEFLNTNDNNAPFEIIITTGKVHRKIMEKTTDLNPNFILMGKSDSKGIKSIIGSNTNRIIAKSAVPVLTLGSAKHISADQILLPLDLSKPVDLKLKKAIEIAHILNESIRVLSVLRSDWKSLETEYRKRLYEIQKIIGEEGIHCNTRLVITKKSVSLEILRYAAEIRAGMIFLMTQQEKKITEFFIGSTAQEILQKSEFPVLSISPELSKGRSPGNPELWDILRPIITRNHT